MARIEQEIARLDIIMLQVVNWASTLKAALAQITKQKNRYHGLNKANPYHQNK